MKGRIFIGSLSAAVVGVVLATAFPSSSAHAEPSDAVCMTGEKAGESEGQAFTILVSPERVSQMKQRGLSVTGCNGREAALSQLRSDICRLSTEGSATVISRFTGIYGVSPAEICAMADEILAQ